MRGPSPTRQAGALTPPGLSCSSLTLSPLSPALLCLLSSLSVQRLSVSACLLGSPSLPHLPWFLPLLSILLPLPCLCLFAHLSGSQSLSHSMPCSLLMSLPPPVRQESHPLGGCDPPDPPPCPQHIALHTPAPQTPMDTLHPQLTAPTADISPADLPCLPSGTRSFPLHQLRA